MLYIIVVSVLALLLFLKQIKLYKYWQDKGVPYSKPTYIVGNFGGTVFRTKSIKDITESSYNDFPNSRYVGLYQFSKPVLMIRDLELIKQMTIKDFDVFPEHANAVPSNIDPLWAKNLFSLSSKDGWDDMRATLSPSFTSSKMKSMFVLMEECSRQFVDYFKNQNGKVTVEIKDAFSRFTNDVIATSAFGVTCDSLKNRNNEFYLMGKDASNFSGVRMLKFLGYSFSPNLMKILNVKIFNANVSRFFRDLITQTVNIRKEQNIIRPDMIHLMMQASKNRHSQNKDKFVRETAVTQNTTEKLELTNDDMAAQALIFFSAGFETVASAMTFLAYELAINPDVQQKLYDEIKETQQNYSEKITYDVLHSMKYLDCVVSESLRLHSPIPTTDRRSIKPYTIQPTSSFEKPLYLETGSVIWIPVSPLLHDEKYFSNPRKFDPERFNEENKHKINPLTYLPFGIGPRNCIGSRFALMEVKLIIVQLLQEFKIVPVEKTAIPLKMDKTNLNNLPAEGIWVGLNPRDADWNYTRSSF